MDKILISDNKQQGLPTDYHKHEHVTGQRQWRLGQQQLPIGALALISEQLLGHSAGDSAIRECSSFDIRHLRPHRPDPGQPNSPTDSGPCRLH